MGKTRMNIRVEVEALAEVMRRYGLSTESEAVNLALRRLAGEQMTREEALAMRGEHALDEIPKDTSPHVEL